MRDIVVKKYKGDRALQRGLNEMAKNGFVVDQQASRKALASATAGVFTRKQIHTVTFRRKGSSEPSAPAAARPAAAPPAASIDVIGQLERLGKLRDSGVLTAEEFDAQKGGLLAGASAGASVPAEVAVSWDVVFTGLVPGTSKIQAIKSVCDIGGIDLKSAKRIVDAAGGEPTALRSGVERTDADSVKGALERVGAVVEIRPASPGV